MKLSRCTNGSIRVLKTCAASGAAGSGLSVTVSPSLMPAARNSSRRQRALHEHGEQFVDADARFGRDADDRRERSLPNRLGRESIELLLRGQLAFEVFLHDFLVGLDDRFEHASLMLAGSMSAPIVPFGTSSVETTPLRSCPCPSGTLNSAQLLPNTSRIESMSCGKLIWSVSSLVMQRMRPRPASPASCQARRVLTLMPAWASMVISAVSTARSAPIVWPMRSG